MDSPQLPYKEWKKFVLTRFAINELFLKAAKESGQPLPKTISDVNKKLRRIITNIQAGNGISMYEQTVKEMSEIAYKSQG